MIELSSWLYCSSLGRVLSAKTSCLRFTYTVYLHQALRSLLIGWHSIGQTYQSWLWLGEQWSVLID